MKLPRDISGEQLVRHLTRQWDYHIDSQQGSHIILVTSFPKHHRLPVQNHKPIAIGILRAILGQVCETKGIALVEVVDGL